MAARHERAAWWLALVAASVAGAAAWWAMHHPLRYELAPLSWGDIAPPTPAHAWRWIVIHHSGTRSGDTRSFDEYHAKRGWEGIGYHFVIGNGSPMPVGRIEATFRWRLQRHGAHAGPAPAQQPYNQDGIGICLVGDYRTQAPDLLLEQRIAELCAVLIEHVPTLSPDAIIGHKQVPGKSTDCPGMIDIDRLRELARKRLRADADAASAGADQEQQ